MNSSTKTELMVGSRLSWISSAMKRKLVKLKKVKTPSLIIAEIVREMHVAIDCFQQNVENIIDEEIIIPKSL